MKTVVIVAILLVCLGSGCSRQNPPPVTLTYLDVEWDTPDQMPGLARDLQAFTQETGIQIKRLPRPDGSLNQLALWRQLLQKGAGAPDVMTIDVIWSGMLGQYLVDLRPLFGDQLASQDPAVLASYTVGDRVVAIPHHAYVGILMYRPYLLRKYGYHEPPRTWDELETMAARIQKEERARGQTDFWGYVWQGGFNEDLTCSGLEWQISEGGGRILEDNKTVSVNNPVAIRSWQRARRWVGSISPPSVVAYEKWDAQNFWGSGKAAFLRSWEGDYSLINGGWPFSGWRSRPASSAEKQFGISSVPGGKAARVDTLGGNGLAISQASGHPREASELVRFLLRRDNQIMRDGEQMPLPAELELYDLPSILKAFGQGARPGQHGGELVARPSVVAGAKYEEVTRAYIGAVHSVLMGEKAAPAAAADLEKQLVGMTGFRPGPPSGRD
jgi:trehalose/maltose transport system substrate-binding protein